MTHDLTQAPATKLLKLYRKGTVSPVEVMQAVLARIEEVDPKLNSFVLVDAERALADARESEKRWKKDEPRGLLDGVPASVKDLLLTKGWPTRKGSKTVDPAGPWNDDAPAVARLRENGAVLFGKTTTPEFGHKGTTQSLLTGVTRNPWNPALTPGGSSGGAASAVASGMGPLALGTDGGGSVRIPASFTGIFGHKPTFGRVPAWPLSPFGTVANVGPMTRTVADGALLFQAITGPDSRDWYALPPDGMNYPKACRQGVKGMKIGLCNDFGMAHTLTGHDADPAIGEAVMTAADVLKAAGATVKKTNLKWPRDPVSIFRTIWTMGSSRLAKEIGKGMEQVDPVFRRFAQAGDTRMLAHFHEAQTRREENWAYLTAIFDEGLDALLGPTMPVVAFKAENTCPTGWEDNPFTWIPFTPPFNLTRHPAASVNGGFSDGLPVGVQIVGPMYQDANVFRCAQVIEKGLGTAGTIPDLEKSNTA